MKLLKKIPFLLVAILTFLPMAGGARAHDGDNAAFVGSSEGPQEVKLTSESIRALRIETLPVKTSGIDDSLSATGSVTAAEQRNFDVTPSVSGMVQSVAAKQGDAVREGQVLATIYSIEVANTLTSLLAEQTRINSELARIDTQYQSDIAIQKNEVQMAKLDFEREQQLLGEGITSRKSFQQAKTSYETAMLKLTTLEQRRKQEKAILERQLKVTIDTSKGQLKIMGMPHAKVDESLKSGEVVATVNLMAPVTGIVLARDITLGERIDPGKKVFSIVDLSPIWVNIDIYQEQIPRVHMGQETTIITPSKQVMTGKISVIGPTVDDEKKTMNVRIEVPNQAGTLRPGMFVTARIVLGHGKGSKLSVPPQAIIEEHGHKYVYRVHEDHFEPQEVEAGLETPEGTEILKGLTAADVVVVNGAKQLLASSMVTQQPHGHGESEGGDHHSHEAELKPENHEAQHMVLFAAGVASMLVLGLLWMGISRLLARGKDRG